MKILKPGKVEQRKFVCYRCECEFTATSGEIEFDTTTEDDLVRCPQKGCGVYMTWDNGEPYEEPTPTQTDKGRLAQLIRDSESFSSAAAKAAYLIANGVTFRKV